MLAKSLFSFFAAFCLAVPVSAASQDLAQQQKQLASAVDRAIHRLADQELQSPTNAAMYLVALVHCHRQYDASDGPVVRPALQAIFRARTSEGLFGQGSPGEKQRTTAWCYQALHDLDAEKYAEDLKRTRMAFMSEFGREGEKLEAALRPFAHGEYGEPANPQQKELIALLQDVARHNEIGAQLAAKKKGDAQPEAMPWEPFEQKALDWLLAQQQGGVWSVPTPDGKSQPDAGVTALGLTALAHKPAAQRSEAEQRYLEAGIKWLLGQQRDDGSFSEFTPNYVTCAAVMATHASDVTGVDVAMKKAQRYLVSIQNVERRGYQPSDRDYGSIGYGGDRRGDLSNTQFALEALRLTGLDSSDEVFQKALVYLRRAQNLPGPGSYSGPFRTEDGEKKTVRAGEDGGAQYYPGVSYAGYDETEDGAVIPRSYGSMTYALLKCYVLAGLPKDDPRLKAALDWTKQNFTVDVNPGADPSLPEKTKFQGLYYYYLTMARAYMFGDIDQVGEKDWRKVLREKLKEEQRPEGYWVNEKNGRWYEQSPLICTAYSLIALRQ